MLKRISFLILLLFIACSKEPPDSDGDGIIDSLDQCPQEAGTAAYDGCPAYTLTVNSNPSDGGYINPNGGTVKAGQQVSLTATPADEFLFEGWSGAETGTSPTISVIMDKNKSITANFVKKQYKVEVRQRNGGTIEVKTIKQGVTNGTDYNSGTILEFKAIPDEDEGFAFNNWLHNVDSDVFPPENLRKNPVQVTVTRPMYISASFGKKRYSGKVNVEGNGKIESDEITNYGQGLIHGSIWEYTAIPDDCNEFVEWTGNYYNGTENPIQITFVKDIELTAKFREKKIELIPKIEGEGSVDIELKSGNRDGDLFDCRSEVTLTAKPKDNYSFIKWEVLYDGVVNSYTNRNPWTFKLYDIPYKLDIRAIFEKN